MMNSIDSTYSGIGAFYSFGGDIFYGGTDFLHIGFNIDLGMISIDEETVRKIHPDAVGGVNSAGLSKISVFANLYPVSFWYLLGGVGLDSYGAYNSKTESVDKISGSGS